jgi:hypothetical protein
MSVYAQILDPTNVEKIGDLGSGLNEIAIYWKEGVYKEFFHYINTTESGDIFGSGILDRFPNLTVCFEDVGLSPQHF